MTPPKLERVSDGHHVCAELQCLEILLCLHRGARLLHRQHLVCVSALQ